NPRRFGNALDTRDLVFFGSHDQLANLCMWNPVVAAIGVKSLAPGNTAARLEAAGRIVKTAMNDLAVARGGLEPDRVSALEHKHALPGPRERTSGREPDHSRANHHAFNFVHHFAPHA